MYIGEKENQITFSVELAQSATVDALITQYDKLSGKVEISEGASKKDTIKASQQQPTCVSPVSPVGGTTEFASTLEKWRQKADQPHIASTENPQILSSSYSDNGTDIPQLISSGNSDTSYVSESTIVTKKQSPQVPEKPQKPQARGIGGSYAMYTALLAKARKKENNNIPTLN